MTKTKDELRALAEQVYPIADSGSLPSRREEDISRIFAWLEQYYQHWPQEIEGATVEEIADLYNEYRWGYDGE